MGRRSGFLAALLLAGLGLHAQQVPGGWKTVKDRQGVCQIAVPGDWVSDKLVASFMQSADGKANAVAHGLRAGQSFTDATSLAKQMMVPSKVIEDSPKRVWYAYQGASSPQGETNWYVAVAGNPVCTAQITFKVAATEETAKKIALSLTQGK
jgi:hypothetical protein